MGGDELAVMVKVLTPSTPVMMLTGVADLMDAADQRPSGVDLMIGKPTTLARLRGATATLIPDQGSDPIADPAPALDHTPSNARPLCPRGPCQASGTIVA